MLGADLGAALELLVEAAERRALVAGHERARQQSARPVGPVLVEQHADEALDAGEEDAAVLEQVLVVEGDLAARALAAPADRGAAAALGALAATAVRSFAKCVGVQASLLGPSGRRPDLWLTKLTISGTQSATPTWRARLDSLSTTIGRVGIAVKGNPSYGQGL